MFAKENIFNHFNYCFNWRGPAARLSSNLYKNAVWEELKYALRGRHIHPFITF